ncbi:MAG: ATP synthase F1 subunit gamma [Fibrella sp.]|nr:ATP synthase F1 subunit gamma [Armatimonadota bacterium]
MATMRQIRSRIKTAKNIQQITKAMKMVAAARLKRAQDRVQSARPYSEKMREMMGSLGRALANSSVSNPLLEVREPAQRAGFLIISADRGLCGSYSTNLLKKATETVKPYVPEETSVILVGRKGQVFFRRRPNPIVGEFTLNMTAVTFADAQTIGRQVRQMYVSGEIDVLYLVYTRFLSALTQKPTAVQLLPIVAEDALAAADLPAGGEEYLFEPDAEGILGRLLPRYVDTIIYQAMAESVASEHGARMTAMSSATDNAKKMISNLTLSLNRARQAKITTELTEIVSGADALK